MNNSPNFKTQPPNQNQAQPTRFQLVFGRLPNSTFWCQTAILPSVSVPFVMSPTPFVDMKMPGEKMEYSSLPLTIIVDEDLQTYREIHDWMRGYAFPTDFKEYRNLSKLSGPIFKGQTAKPQYSDIFIHIYNNNWQRILTWKFIDAFPTLLGELNYSATDSPDTTMIIDATFDYQYFDIIPANSTVA